MGTTYFVKYIEEKPSRPLISPPPSAIVPAEDFDMDKHNVAELAPEDVIWETRTFAIEGMTCDNCVKHITRAIRSVNGVKSIDVDRENARATVTYDNTKTDIPAIWDALKASGYHARPWAYEDSVDEH